MLRFLYNMVLLSVMMVVSGEAKTMANTASLIFMSGNSQELGGSHAWSLNLTTQKATMLVPDKINQTADFSSRACICNDVYYTLWWKLPDPSNAENRLYGIASIDESGPGSGSRAIYSEAELPDNYYGIWCDPTDRLKADRRVDAKKSQTSAAAAAASLLLLRSTKQDGGDPLRADTFYVDRYTPATKGVEVVAGPIKLPANEYIPVADGIFSFDGVSKLWASYSAAAPLNKNHFNTGQTAVLDITNNDTTVHTYPKGSGYLFQTQATPGGKTWGVMKHLERKDTKLKLELVELVLSPSKKVAVSGHIDITTRAGSMGLPATQCGIDGGPIYTYNTDNYHWFNLTAIDPRTGAIIFNDDTLDLLPDQQYAFVAGIACKY